MLGLILAATGSGTGASAGGTALPGVSPSASGLIGTTTAQTFASGVMFYALIFTVVGVVLSAGMWAIGSFSSNYTQSVNGKKGFLICAGAALAIGAAKIAVGYFENAGSHLS